MACGGEAAFFNIFGKMSCSSSFHILCAFRSIFPLMPPMSLLDPSRSVSLSHKAKQNNAEQRVAP